MTGFALSLVLMCAVALAAYLAASAYYRRPIPARVLAVIILPDELIEFRQLTARRSIRDAGGKWSTAIYDRRVVASAGA